MDFVTSEIAQRQLGRVDGAANVDIKNSKRGRLEPLVFVKGVEKCILNNLIYPGIGEDNIDPPILLNCLLKDVKLIIPTGNRAMEEVNANRDKQ
jgi:hypothetical protein